MSQERHRNARSSWQTTYTGFTCNVEERASEVNFLLAEA